MKELFSKTRARCATCNTPVDGRYKKGEKYYCASDFEKIGAEEVRENREEEKEYKFYKKLVSGTS